MIYGGKGPRSNSLIFFGDYYVIFGAFLVGTGEPPQCCDKFPVLYGCGFGFKKLVLGQTPAPLIGTKSQFLTIFLKAPLMIIELNLNI